MRKGEKFTINNSNGDAKDEEKNVNSKKWQ